MDSIVFSEPNLTVQIGGESGWYRASCPELGVAGSGVSPEEAKGKLYQSAKLMARHLVGLNGAAHHDPRKPYAEIILRHWNDLEAIFSRE